MKLRKYQHAFLTFDHGLADLLQPLELAAVSRIVVVLTQELSRVITNLLELHQRGQDHSVAFNAFRRFESLLEIVQRPFVKRDLFLRQTAFSSHLRLVRQIRDDAWIGLESPQDIGTHECAECSPVRDVLLLIQTL